MGAGASSLSQAAEMSQEDKEIIGTVLLVSLLYETFKGFIS